MKDYEPVKLPRFVWWGVLALVAFLLVGSLAGCSEAGKNNAAPETVTETVTQTVTAPPEASVRPVVHHPSYATFDGSYFTVDYPDAWNVEAAEVSKGGYLDTTIRSLTNPDLMIRVDVTPTDGTPIDISSAADSVESTLASQPGYRELRFEPSLFQGYDSIDWEFLVQENGVLFRKRDVFFTDEYGEGVAILTQAPAASYPRWRFAFRHVRNSLVVVSSEASSPPATPNADFCSSHECIESFYDGTGYIVQCNDGMWSHSGGRPGACSYHGGRERQYLLRLGFGKLRRVKLGFRPRSRERLDGSLRGWLDQPFRRRSGSVLTSRRRRSVTVGFGLGRQGHLPRFSGSAFRSQTVVAANVLTAASRVRPASVQRTGVNRRSRADLAVALPESLAHQASIEGSFWRLRQDRPSVRVLSGRRRPPPAPAPGPCPGSILRPPHGGTSTRLSGFETASRISLLDRASLKDWLDGTASTPPCPSAGSTRRRVERCE